MSISFPHGIQAQTGMICGTGRAGMKKIGRAIITYTPQRSPQRDPCSPRPPAAGSHAQRTHRSGACRGRTGRSWRTLFEYSISFNPSHSYSIIICRISVNGPVTTNRFPNRANGMSTPTGLRRATSTPGF